MEREIKESIKKVNPISRGPALMSSKVHLAQYQVTLHAKVIMPDSQRYP